MTESLTNSRRITCVRLCQSAVPRVHLHVLVLCRAHPCIIPGPCQTVNYNLRSYDHVWLPECTACPYFKTCISCCCRRFEQAKTRHKALWVNPMSPLISSLLTGKESRLCVHGLLWHFKTIEFCRVPFFSNVSISRWPVTGALGIPFLIRAASQRRITPFMRQLLSYFFLYRRLFIKASSKSHTAK